ncbi:OTU domain-containing protein 3 [Moschus berezovskii]|uniref:OTU domain-containing protein 3 n=1 Tax=Moschus berezovskii TaxID=68408 RepID=UPI0024447BDE|nr:OTU domain-containing protein 3 [Moschus berezovskii]
MAFQVLHQDESNKREKSKVKGVDFEDDLRDEVEDAVQKVCNATGCSDFDLIVQNLEAENYNIESAIIAMLQMNQGRRNTSIRRRQWQPTPVLLPGKSHGRRSLVGCSPWGREESDMTEQLHFHFSLPCIVEGNGNPLQCSCLENSRDGGAWWAAVSGVTQSWYYQLRRQGGSLFSGHKQTEARTAATREEEAAGGAAASQSPGEQEQPQGQQQKRRGCERPGHLGEDLRGSQHLTLASWELRGADGKCRAVCQAFQ